MALSDALIFLLHQAVIAINDCVPTQVLSSRLASRWRVNVVRVAAGYASTRVADAVTYLVL